MTGEEIECAAESMTWSGGDFLKLELRDDNVETSWCSHAGSDVSETGLGKVAVHNRSDRLNSNPRHVSKKAMRFCSGGRRFSIKNQARWQVGTGTTTA